MSNIAFENIAAEIAARTITAAEIIAYPCSDLTQSERVALLTLLATTLVADGTEKTLAAVQTGLLEDGVITVPAFLSGRLQCIDTDGTAVASLDGTHQFVTDSLGDSYPEETLSEWAPTVGKFFAGRDFTVPVGVKALYSFTLKD